MTALKAGDRVTIKGDLVVTYVTRDGNVHFTSASGTEWCVRVDEVEQVLPPQPPVGSIVRATLNGDGARWIREPGGWRFIYSNGNQSDSTSHWKWADIVRYQPQLLS